MTDNPPAAARPRSLARPLVRFVVWLTLTMALIYGALQLLVRTDFFRSLVEKELSDLAGMEIRVGRIRATESLNLRLRDTIGVSDVAGIEARLARIRWRLFRPRGEPMLESLRVDGLSLTIAPDESGRLQPQFLSELSRTIFQWTGLPPPAALAELAAPAATTATPVRATGLASPEQWLRGPLALRGVTVRWQDAKGKVLATASGLDLIWTALVTPNGRRVSHLECNAGDLQLTRGPRIRDLHVELVGVNGKRFLVELTAADWGGATPPPPPGAEARALLDSLDSPAP